jgi:hypothetical protein
MKHTGGGGGGFTGPRPLSHAQAQCETESMCHAVDHDLPFQARRLSL